MGKSKQSGTNFLVQGSILAIASIISRIIGLIYRIPMTAIIGDVGNNYYGCAFDIYNIILIISSCSLPQAVSKTVSAQVAKGRFRSACQVFKGAMLFAVISGLIAALIVFFGAEFFTATLLKTPKSVYALKVLAPVLFVVAVLGVFRGFFQGLGTMMPSAVSQIIEQIANAIVSVWAAYVLFGMGKRVGAVLGDSEHYAAAYGAAGGTLGTASGALAGLLFVIFVFVVYLKVLRRRMKRERKADVDPFFYTFKILIITIIPVLLSTTIYNISGIIDQGIFKNVALLQGHTEHEIDVWWGVFSGKYKLLINIPIAIASAMAASSVPTLTASFVESDMERVRSQIHAATRFVMVIAFPCTVGLTVLAKPIFLLLFPSTAGTADMAASIMLCGSLAVVFYSLSTLSNGLLQGIDQLKVPVVNAVVALVAHIILLVVLMMFFRMNIYAVVLANMFFALLMCVLNARAIRKYSGYKQEIKKTFFIPALCSLIMGVVTWLVYKGFYALCKSNTVSALAAIVAAVLVYFVTLLLLRGMDEEDLSGFPKGQLIIKIAKKMHLLK
ncbi:MAG: polysaccharide biosynthesis protein [Roseburia sp.]|nr:polysaccharide biosynthesis protein [Roseburia sp.]MCM1430960.1 polysaccharide biosynthesis protein [Muribaculaceae bacterium]